MKTIIQILLSFLLLLASSLSSDSLYSQGWNRQAMNDMKEWEIGGDVEDENYIFTSISSIYIDSKGKLYALDYLDHQVKIFNSNGRHIKTFGGINTTKCFDTEEEGFEPPWEN